jgi:hypothetical protein
MRRVALDHLLEPLLLDAHGFEIVVESLFVCKESLVLQLALTE